MRVVSLARTLGVGGFAGLSSASGQLMAKSLGGLTPASQACSQHTKVEPGGTDAEAGDRTPRDIPDPFDLEFDRFNGGAMADAEAARRPRMVSDPIEDRPVDLEFEMDRDDPDIVDLETLYESPNEEEDEFLVKEVDLDDEYDLIHDHALGVTEPSPPENKTGPGHMPPTSTGFEAIKTAASGGSPPPKPAAGA